jgi:hypothetical protein
MLNRAKVPSASAAMALCIARHRRWHTAVADLSRRKADSWTIRAIVAGLGLVFARSFEMSARRRLIHRKPEDAAEAEQKVLYLMGAAIARNMVLNPDEAAQVGASVKDFTAELTEFLQTH